MIKKYIQLFKFSLCITLMASPALSQDNAYKFTFDSLMTEEPIQLSNYKGKAIFIVNTASNCGFTGQYEGLENLYNTYKDKGLVVIGVPSNDFAQQEPGTNEEIAKFCKFNYGVSFPMASKYSVVGDQAHPFYKWAKDQLGFGTAPKWNFHKYLINTKGELVEYFYSPTDPEADRVIEAIEKALEK